LLFEILSCLGLLNLRIDAEVNCKKDLNGQYMAFAKALGQVAPSLISAGAARLADGGIITVA
jgi:hypothetical protein